MIIKTDAMGRSGIEWLVDIALRAYGIKARDRCDQILNAVEEIKPEKKVSKEKT